MSKQTNIRNGAKGKGFYIALALVVAAAATVSYLSIMRMMDTLTAPQSTSQENTQEDPLWNMEELPIDTNQSEVPTQPEASSASQSGSSSQAQQATSSSPHREPADLQSVQTPSFALPLDGVISAPFSGNELVFNKTMNDWRTHNGMDIDAAPNTTVKAPTKGRIGAVYNDPQWGGVVEIDAGEVTFRLCGIKDTRVSVNDTVAQGNEIGVLGGIEAESVGAPHLHVEAFENNKNVDPASYFAR